MAECEGWPFFQSTTTRQRFTTSWRVQGLTSSYEAFMNWFSEDGNLAPQQFDEFEILAKECATYASRVLITTTFEAVKQRREDAIARAVAN